MALWLSQVLHYNSPTFDIYNARIVTILHFHRHHRKMVTFEQKWLFDEWFIMSLQYYYQVKRIGWKRHYCDDDLRKTGG